VGSGAHAPRRPFAIARADPAIVQRSYSDARVITALPLATGLQ